MTEILEKVLTKTYTKQQTEKATLEYFKGDQLATDVWIKKYCLKDENHYYELTPDDMHWRIAKELARIEDKYPNPLSVEEIYETLKSFKRIVPQGSPMSGIGNNFQVVSLSNCFVIGNDGDSDSYGGIMKTDQEQVQLMKRRGGVGHDLSHIRPKGSPVKNSAITSTGIVPFMERYSNTTKEVAQDGRRGALMLSVSINHPDSESFIDAKMNNGKVTGANVSVKLTDKFMDAAINEKGFTQQYPIIGDNPKFTKEINATNLWKKIIYNAWKSAEPGILFWDTIQRESVADCYSDLGYKTISTNPCGEIPLCPNDSCRLLAINLFGYVHNPFTPEAYFNNYTFINDVVIAMRYMDDIIDLELEKIDAILAKIKSDPEDEFVKLYELNLWIKIKEKTINGRRTGFGVTGEGDMLAALGLTYGTDKATDFSEKIHEMLKINAYRSSVIMAKERDAFPIYDHKREMNNPFILRIKESDPELYDNMCRYGRRNIALLTIAPTGCSDKDSIVTSKNGFLKLSELCDLNKYGFHELSRNIDVIQDVGYAKATKAFNNGFSKTKRILTTSGIELESTLNHKYKVITEDGKYIWKEVSNLIEGDMIVSRIGGYNKTTNAKLEKVKMLNNEKHWEFKLKDITQPSEITESFAKFLGIFYADGSVHKKGIRIHCNYGDVQVQETIKLIKENFNIDVKSYIERTCESVYISSKTILDFLKKNDLLKQKAHKVEIPLLVRMSSKKSIEAFLDGYWMGDGSQTNNTKYIDTVSKKMAQQIAIISRGLGKNIRISVDTERKNSFGKRPLYRVYEKGFGSIDFKNERYIRKDNKKWLKLTREYGNELFFDEIVDIIDSETQTLDIEVPNKNMYVLNSSISHNTVSLMTQTTSGIENCFLLTYMRRRKINPQEKDMRVDFIDDEGIAWMEYPVFHHNFELWLEIAGYNIDVVKTMNKEQIDEIIKKSPYYKATSIDVNWVKKVEMQGRIQKHVDHSISTTINLPENATEEIVAKVYETGWRSGCKGITVYRDGSRSGVLVSIDKKEDNEEIHVSKRPKRLKADIHRFQNNLEKWIAVVGIKNGKPYEIFTGKLQNGLINLPANIKECEVVKNIVEIDGIKKKRYDIEYIINNDEKQIHEGLNHAFNPEYWNYAKFISGVLRHRMPLVYVYDLVDSLTFQEDHINTWKNGVGRVIKRYIKDGEKGKGKCLDCGSDHLEYKEGCLICMSCGNSKCG